MLLCCPRNSRPWHSPCGLREPPSLRPTSYQGSSAGSRWSTCPRWVRGRLGRYSSAVMGRAQASLQKGSRLCLWKGNGLLFKCQCSFQSGWLLWFFFSSIRYIPVSLLLQMEHFTDSSNTADEWAVSVSGLVGRGPGTLFTRPLPHTFLILIDP